METERVPVTETIHGVEIVDPYRWLEGSDAPEVERRDEELDRRVAEWTAAQNARTREFLDAIPGRAELESALRPLLEIGELEAVAMAGRRVFHSERKGGQAQAVIYVREGIDGEPRPILDPNELDLDGLTVVSWISPSPDGSLLAFGLFRAGDEKDVLHVLDVDRGERLGDELPGKVQGADWLPDGRSFIYRALSDVENPYSGVVRHHRLGDAQSDDRVLFEQFEEGPLATTWGPFPMTDRDGHWLVLAYFTGTDRNDLWAVDLDRFLRTGEFVTEEILVGEPSRGMGTIVGNTFFLHTTYGASNGRLVAVDLFRPGREHWTEVLPEREDAVLQGVAVGRGVLVARYVKHATTRLTRHRYDGELLGEIELPGPGTAGVYAVPDRTEAFLFFESFHFPRSVYRLDLATGEKELWARPDVPADTGGVEVEQVFVPSKDGTKIPMFLVRKKGLAKTGDVPTVLTGYGGFGLSRVPAFSATLLPWLERGGMYAVANLRGGGEYGEEWHRAGMRERKQNVFDDFHAAAKWLVSEGWTSPRRLAAHGGSNGGLLVGAALTQRPDLFGAIVCAVPLLDMLRYQHFLMARYWAPEYGTAENEEEFRWLLDYSPYHHVEEGTEYPATLFIAGEHDVRVHPAHARKMYARVAAATSGDPGEKPILLWVDQSSGHGRGKPLSIRLRDSADLWSFLIRQIGS